MCIHQFSLTKRNSFDLNQSMLAQIVLKPETGVSWIGDLNIVVYLKC